MRKIKFKVWDDLYKRWVKDDGTVLITPGGKIFTFEEVNPGRAGNPYKAFFYKGHYRLLQFTGFYDVDGREIYEGDIVKATELDFGYDYGRVIWFEGLAQFSIEWNKYNDFGSFYEFAYRDKNGKVTRKTELKIIRNIFENQEFEFDGDYNPENGKK